MADPMAEFEAACARLQIPQQRREAEAVLQAFRSLPNALQLSVDLIERGSSPVKFHAAGALRDVLLASYSAGSRSTIHAIRNRLLDYTIAIFHSTEHYVRESLLQVIALVSKRGWIEDSPTEKEIPFARLTGLLSPSAALDAHSIGLSLLSALLNEFGSDKASAVGLPNEFHLRCHRSFEMERLLPLLGQLFTVMHPLTSQITGALSPDQGAVLGLCFNVLDKILSWEFLQTEDGDVSSKALLSNSHNNLLEETGVASCTRFPPPWREALGRPDVIEMLFRGHEILKADERLCHKSRQCLIHLSSLSADTFEGSNLERPFVTHFLSCFLKMLDLHLAKTLQTGRDDLDEDELAGVPQITKRILQNHPLTLLGALPDFIPFLQCLGKLSIQTICICSASDDDPIIESLEDFLDIWASLSLDAQSLYDERITFKQPITEFEFPSFFQLLKAVSAAVFGEYLGYILRFAEGHAMDDEEDTHGFKDYDLYADPLLNAASVARLDPSQSTQKLLQCLTERIQLLEQILKSGQADQRLGILYEQLHWLIILSGFVLADSGKGETPLVNDAIMQVSILYEGQDDDPIRGLATTLLRLLEMLSIDPSSPLFNNLSPTLIETLFWFIERWGRTYLMIDASQYGQCSGSLIKSFGTPGDGAQVLDYLLEKIQKNAATWTSEADVIFMIIKTIKGLSNSSQVRNALLASGKFNSLVLFFLNNLAKLPSTVHSLLVETIALIASHAPTPELRNQYFSSLSGAIESRLTNLLTRPDFMTLHKQQNVMEKVMDVLEMYDGLTLAADEINTVPIFEACAVHFDAFIKLLDMYHNFPEFELFVLQIFSHLAAHLFFESLSAEQKSRFNSSIMKLIAVYTKNESGRSRSAGKDSEEELFEDLSCLLSLLANLITGEFEGLDKSQVLANRAQQGNTVTVAQVVFYGVGAIIPLISESMLSYPTLCKDYIYLITEILEYFPFKLKDLGTGLLTSIIKSLEFGMNNPIFEVATSAFDAISTLGFFSWFEMIRKGPETVAFLGPYLDQLMTRIFGYIFLEDFESRLVGKAGDALFALTMARQDTFSLLVQQLIQQQTSSTETQHRLSKAFTSLTQTMIKVANVSHEGIVKGVIEIGFGEFMGTASLPHFKTYHDQFPLFVVETRGILRVK